MSGEFGKLKHGDIIDRLRQIEANLELLQLRQQELIKKSRKISLISQYATLALQIRGRRRYLHWRQRYYKRGFFTLYDDHGLFMLDKFKSQQADILELDEKRLYLNFYYQTLAQEIECLTTLNENLSLWRKVRGKA